MSMLYGSMRYLQVALCLLMLLCACSKDELPKNEAKGRVDVYVRVIASAITKGAGDPGESSGEELMWDNLRIIFGASHGIISKELSKAEFDALPEAAGYSGAKIISMVVPAGEYRVYGVAYQKSIHGDLHARLIDPTLDVNKLNTITLSNHNANKSNYLTLAANVTDKLVNVGDPKASVYLLVTRLASKIDIQWDVTDAYYKYTDVGVGKFSCEIPSEGYLFPSLNGATAAKQTITSVFINNTPISRRNGRLYHYIFTDAANLTMFKFHIDANEIGADGMSLNPVKKDYTFKFNTALLSGSWYKVNVAIRGLSGTQTIYEINNSGQSLIP